ncbi:MAG: metallophosphoesterase [Flavobacteriales bacterium]|nr:metallophosphoesterase [Flavobacteriales bacterium]MCC6939523.1 metallophosphoesterase [Flavobacteriales bacterium]
MKHVACSLLLVFAFSASAQRSRFTGLQVPPADSTGYYRILIGGHFHGESTNRSGYPASTLLANLDTINSLGANLFLSTGDLFMDAEKDRERYERAFFSKLKVPFFNAPGNHDLAGAVGDEVVEMGRIQCGTDIILILNTEVNDGSLSKRSIDQLQAIIAPPSDSASARVIIISHRPIWAEDDPQYSDLFKDNTRSLTGTNFEKDVYPILEKIAEHAHLYWISGSLGGQAPSSIFFQQHAPNITFIQCAIRDEPRDALLIADVYPDSVHWSALSLTGQALKAPETYDAAWWRKQTGRGESFNWRLLPYMIKTTVTHAAFWWGAAFALVLVFMVRRFLRR